MGFFSSLSFLTPLYVAAGLAIGLPILFHLIRRTPQGRQVFSSVMFLTPSPPRITRRSRIEDWLLLLLRGLAVLLIVAAFCRPLWRELLAEEDAAPGRDFVLLIDTSASMNRDGLWEAAVDALSRTIGGLRPEDRAALLQFDDEIVPVMEHQEWTELDPAQRQTVLLERVRGLRPGWGATELGRALLAAVDRLEQAESGPAATGQRTIVVVSDLQIGSRWESLQGFAWPEGIRVELVRIGVPGDPTNAAVQLVGRPEPGETPFVRLRVTNAADSRREQFTVGWRDEFDAAGSSGPTTGLVDVYVPPGQSRVIRLPREATVGTTARAVLRGDAQEFDNTCFVAWTARRQERIVYLGPDAADDRTQMRFFIPPLFAQTAERTVSIVDGWPADDSPDAGSGSPSLRPGTAIGLAIVTGEVEPADEQRLKKHLTTGGVVLYVCREGESAAGLYRLLDAEPQPVTEAGVTDYVMLREVDFTHPAFAALSDPRFSDLSKVHFWRHRTLNEESLPNVRVLARFDDGDPALCEAPVGDGRVLVLTSGWSRDDSELATWPKFIPIMNSLLSLSRRGAGEPDQLVVGDRLPIDRLEELRPPPATVTLPDGTEVGWRTFREDPRARRPGVYRVRSGETEAAGGSAAVFAVNLAADESRTEPLGSDVLESLGVRLSGSEASTERPTDRREQVARSELESRQKLWRWLLAGALGVLLLETLLAARTGRAAPPAA